MQTVHYLASLFILEKKEKQSELRSRTKVFQEVVNALLNLLYYCSPKWKEEELLVSFSPFCFSLFLRAFLIESAL